MSYDILGISRDMMFYTFDDFMKRRLYIKANLYLKDKKYIALYNLYVESRPWIKEYYRGCIWDYLMGYMDEKELIDNYNKYINKLNRGVGHA